MLRAEADLMMEARARMGSRNGSVPLGTVALVTPYPNGDATPVSGVASYSFALARALADTGIEVEVWADQVPHASRTEGETAKVIRAWRRGAWIGFDLWRTLRARRPAVLHAQIEYFAFGGWLGFASLLGFLVASRVTGLKIFLTVHQVLGVRELNRRTLREFGLNLPVRVAHALVRFSMTLLSWVADRILVHDLIFSQRLAEDYGLNRARIAVIPHGVPDISGSPKARSGKRILLFGYLKWYKGFDIALRAFRALASEFPDWKLIVAGGLPPDVGVDHPHRRFVDQLRSLAEPLGNQVEFAGYVDDAQVPILFRNADIVLFPYRVLFASSGPLALAMGFRTPFILSETMRVLLPSWPFCCPTSSTSWASMMRQVMADHTMRLQAAEQADLLARSRSWSAVAARTAEEYWAVASLVSVPSTSA